jgi:hypothetical protein
MGAGEQRFMCSVETEDSHLDDSSKLFNSMVLMPLACEGLAIEKESAMHH